MQRSMPPPERTATARARVVRDITAKQGQITRLQRDLARATTELNRLRRLLRDLEREGVAAEPTTRSTSVGRVLAEQLILRRLDRNGYRETSSDELWPIVRSAGVKTRSTLRSRLRRMAEKGMIASSRPGYWRLAANVIVSRVIDPELEKALKAIEASRGDKR